METFKAYFADIGVNMRIALESLGRAGKIEQMSGGGSAVPPISNIEYYYSQGSDAAICGLAATSGDVKYDALQRLKFWSATDTDSVMKIAQQIDKYFIEWIWVVLMSETFSFNVWNPWLKD